MVWWHVTHDVCLLVEGRLPPAHLQLDVGRERFFDRVDLADLQERHSHAHHRLKHDTRTLTTV